MSGETVITIHGHLTSDPELRFVPSGQAVANFTIASTPRKFDKASNSWVDEETLFLRCSIWRDAAENVVESLSRGSRVIATGRLKQRSYDDKKTSEKRSVIELEVDEIGASLKSAVVKINKTQRGAGSGGLGGGNTSGGFGGNSGGSAQADDPWATGPKSATEEPPF